jgi:hypothetical protein
MTKTSSKKSAKLKPTESELLTISVEEFEFLKILREEMKKDQAPKPIKGAMDWFYK